MITMHFQILQKKLSDALKYWLYESFFASSLRQSFIEKLFLRIKPLLECIKAFQLCDIPLDIQKMRIYRGHVSSREYAELLAGFFQVWEQHIPQTDTNFTIAPSGENYAAWFDKGGANSYYRPVHMLRRILDKEGRTYFKKAIIHGSIATLDDTIGFSDMDLAFVVKTSVLKDPAALLRLRILARRILTLTHAFDPFMHHGPYYIPEIDLAWYSEAMFPSIIFGYGIDLVGQNEDLEIWARDSAYETDQMLDMFRDFFNSWASKPIILKDGFDVEWVLGNVMILPALYYQRLTGNFLFKRDSFQQTKSDFTPQEWEVIRIATDLRATLGPRPRPGYLLLLVASLLRWPFFLQKWAKNHPESIQRANDVQYKLGRDYISKVIKFLAAIQQRLTSRTEDTKYNDDRSTSKHEAFPFHKSLFKGVSKGPFIDIPRKKTTSSYDKTTNYLVDHWVKTSKPPVAVYQIGRVGVPGISDLDFILVYSDDVVLDWRNFQPESFPEWVRFHLTHAPYICPESVWADIPYWYPVFDIKHLWGDRLTTLEVPSDHAAGVYMGILIDYLMVKIPVDILWIAWTKPIRLRILLCMLHSLQYTYQLAEMANLPVSDEYKGIVSRINNLREGWFELPPERFTILEELTERACNLAGDLIELVDRFLSGPKSSLSNISPSDQGKCDPRFIAPWQYKNALNIAAASRWFSDTIAWPNPASFQKVLSLYASVSPALGNYFEKQGFNINGNWDGGIWGKGLKLHAKAMVNYAEKAFTMGVPPQKYIALGYPGVRVERSLQLWNNFFKLLKMLK